MDDDGLGAVAAAAHGFDEGDAVVVAVFGGEQVARDGVGGLQDLPRVAVVDLEDGGAALGLDAHAFEAEVLFAAALVDALRVVVQHQQAVGGGVHHLGDELEPFGRKVVAFVDEHGQVLAGGDVAPVHAGDDALDHVGKEGVLRLVVSGQGLPIGHQLGACPFVEVDAVHAIAQALGGHGGGELDGQRLVVAKHQHGLACGVGAGQVFGAVAQHHGFAGARHAVDDAVAVAQAAGQLLLLQVHHAQHVGHFGLHVGLVEQAGLLGDAHLRKENPAHAVDLRQGERVVALVGEHLPQAALKSLGLHAVGHLVAADDTVGCDGLAQLRFGELLAGDVGQHHAVAPRKHHFALAAAIGVHQALVGAQGIEHGVGVVAGLGEGGLDGFGLVAGGVQNGPVFLVCLHDGAQAEVFDLQNQQPPAGVQHDEVGVQLLRADGHVVPKQVVVVELVFQPLGQALFSRCHAPQARTQCRYQCRHAAGASPELVCNC